MKQECFNCGREMEKMKLQAGGSGHNIDLVTDELKDGILGSLGAKKKLTPVPYVCPKCRRIQFFAEG
ncbi:hypothetical protein [Halocatena pleomorpha]|uniref:Nucleic acid-binding protein n=1 Tax=Halocatena pleomorpha TaxID=1785090 RepID=A0A3P3R3N7_9EURY|nr:hypothetical protein [Halocatena pleomorpha]RRJ28101.1 hypothetical protein EIK79_16625 [Halocatena pleomorpha]